METVTTALPLICSLVQGCEPQPFVNGAVHWLAYRNTDDHKFHHFVLVFDLVDEVFSEKLLPELPGYSLIQLCAYGNSIALFQKKDSDYSAYQNIWVMEEYGVESLWTRVLTIDDQGLGWAVGFRRNGEVVLSLNEGLFVSCDLDTHKMKDLRICSQIYTFVDSYVESLVLLDKPTNVSDTY